MKQQHIRRSLEPILRRAVSDFPVVVLTGPRQSGKTTLLKHLFGWDFGYVSLEPPDIRMAAEQDPRSFLRHHPPPVMFDEVQHAPGLLPYIKEAVDARRSEAGQFILTSSQNLLLTERITESLAGRMAMLRLLPLSRAEAAGAPQTPFPWDRGASGRIASPVGVEMLWTEFLRGAYPELIAHPDRDSDLWHASYVQTYLERDVRALRQVGDLSQFQTFLRALAARDAQLLQLSELARELGVAVNTVKAWLSVLEATYQVLVLRPYSANVGKRLVKTPKVYFTDLGTLCYLAGLKDPRHAAAGPMGGAIMETAVIVEIWKRHIHHGQEPRMWFWRTSGGSEVDLLVEVEEGLVPIEIKSSATPRPAFAAPIGAFREDVGNRALPGYVIYAGDLLLPLGRDVTALPITAL